MKPFFIALSTLSLLPSPPGKWDPRELRASMMFYPLVGAGIGALVALNRSWPQGPKVAALFALLTWVLLTLAFHLDGLADCLDGWLGGRDAKERRRIMKDPSLGAYGAVGLFSVLLSKYVLLAVLFTRPEAWKLLVVIAAAARWGAVLSCWVHPSRPTAPGLAAPFLHLPAPYFAAASLSLLPGILLLGWAFAWPVLLSAAIALFWQALSRSLIGRLTGDGLGATIESSETALLAAAALGLF